MINYIVRHKITINGRTYNRGDIVSIARVDAVRLLKHGEIAPEKGTITGKNEKDKSAKK